MPQGPANIGRPGVEVDQEVIIFTEEKPSELDAQIFERVQNTILRADRGGLVKIGDDEDLPYGLFVTLSSNKVFTENIDRLLDELKELDNERLADIVHSTRWQVNARVKGAVAGGPRPLADANQRVTTQVKGIESTPRSITDVNEELEHKIEYLMLKQFNEEDIEAISADVGNAEVNVILDEERTNNTEVSVIHAAVLSSFNDVLEKVEVRQTIIEGV